MLLQGQPAYVDQFFGSETGKGRQETKQWGEVTVRGYSSHFRGNDSDLYSKRYQCWKTRKIPGRTGTCMRVASLSYILGKEEELRS